MILSKLASSSSSSLSAAATSLLLIRRQFACSSINNVAATNTALYASHDKQQQQQQRRIRQSKEKFPRRKWRQQPQRQQQQQQKNFFTKDNRRKQLQLKDAGQKAPLLQLFTTSLLQQQQQQKIIKRQYRYYYGTSAKNNSSSDGSNSSSDNDSDSSSNKISNMKDEYDEMTSDGYTYVHSEPFELECGEVLEEVQLRYQTYGTLNKKRDNVLVICHALTGNASLHSWWGELLGPNKAFDTDKYFIVCCNILGSCYGSTSPASTIPNNTTLDKDSKPQKYGINFPDVSVQDTVKIQLIMLQKQLNISSIKCVIGGSFGGMQVLEYAVQGGSHQFGNFFEINNNTNNNNTNKESQQKQQPYVRSVIPIAAGAYHTGWQIAISETQRQAIYADPNWISGNYSEAKNGLNVARQMAMISYRTSLGYNEKFHRGIMKTSTSSSLSSTEKNSSKKTPQKNSPYYGSKTNWKVKSYLRYQGKKFLDRFDPITYVKMTEQMDSHDLSRNRTFLPSNYQHHQDDDVNHDIDYKTNIANVLKAISIPVRVLAINSDYLYPIWEQQELAENIPNAELRIIESIDGHDGFLLEQTQVANYITKFLNKHK